MLKNIIRFKNGNIIGIHENVSDLIIPVNETYEVYEDRESFSQRLKEIELEKQLLESLIPSQEEIQKAETELLVIEILTDGGLI